MSKNILITGASGLIGSRLTKMLLQKGYHVSHLGRAKKSGPVNSFVWNVDKGEIDQEALTGIDTIIHLAGAGVADKRWNENRKQEILESRTKSSALLYETLKKGNHSVKAVVSASAIGYYGFCLDERIFTEDSKPGSDYLAQVTKAWEEKVDKISSLGIRVAKLRIGIVLSEKGGALAEMAKPVRFGVGAPLGTGKQYLSWIHIDDLCSLFIKAVEDEQMHGAYNAVCDWVTNEAITKSIARVLRKPLWLPPVPGFIMKIIVGEMAVIVVNGSKVSSEKIRKIGFTFQYPELNEALIELLNRSAKSQK
jgi:uncharacterized protein (TIGR01777 family)